MSKSARGFEQRSTLSALEEIRAELEQLSEHELLHQNVVPVAALVTIRGVYRELMGLRAEMLQLPDFDIANLDRLELYALAFAGAQAQCDALRDSNREPEALKAEAEALRAQLYSDVKALVFRKIIPPQRIENLSRRRGYVQGASDLLLLTAVFRCHANALTGKCATTDEELVRAAALAHSLTIVVSRRREPLEAFGDALEVRKRAFTLFMRAYGQVRRAVHYLRSEHGDADRLAPPLTGKRKRAPRKSQKDEAAVSTESAAAPAAVEPRPALEISERVGLPGSNPFLN